MPDTTTIQSLPLIQPSQAQKHITHNEALKILDLIVQMSVLTRDTTVPPPSPVLGESHIVPVSATGVWATHAKAVATFTGIVWEYFSPVVGWQAYVTAEAVVAVYDGTDWTTPAEVAVEFSALGVNATASSSDRLTVASAGSLFDHDGAGHRLKINKATAGDSASVLLQTAGAGRVEIGTLGDDALTFKISADGTNWQDALKIMATSSTTAAVMMGGASVTALYAGIGGATGDATNRLAINAPATLLNNAGAGHQLKINKALATDTASLMFQTGFSGRAEMGTSGSDDFAIKVSADGSAFTEAVAFDRGTGRTKVQKGLRLTPAAGDLAGPVDGELWYDATAGKFRAQQGGASVDLIGGGGGGGSGVFSDSTFTLQDNGDATKQAKFEVSGISSGTTRTLTVPNSNLTLAGVNLAQTFTGVQTFNNGISVPGGTLSVGSSGPSAMIFKSGIPTAIPVGGSTNASIITTSGTSTSSIHVGIEIPSNDINDGFYIATDANQDGVVDTLALRINAGGQITVSKFLGSGLVVVDDTDKTKAVQLQVSGVASGATRTLSVPDASGTLALTAAAQTLTNKAIDLQANTITGTLAASSVTMSGGGTVQDYGGLATRAAFVSWAVGKTPAVGTVIDAAGFSYRYIGSGTVISDLPGWVPLGYAYPDHWVQNVSPGVTEHGQCHRRGAGLFGHGLYGRRHLCGGIDRRVGQWLFDRQERPGHGADPDSGHRGQHSGGAGDCGAGAVLNPQVDPDRL